MLTAHGLGALNVTSQPHNLKISNEALVANLYRKQAYMLGTFSRA